MSHPYSTRPGPSALVSASTSSVASAGGSLRREAVQPLRRRSRHAVLQVAAAALLSAAAGTLAAAGDADAGAAKAWTCLGCHGVEHYVNVYPSYHVPRIAGQNEEYLISALQSYRGKLRAHPTMQANAGLLSDQDIEDIAAWFAQQGAGK